MRAIAVFLDILGSSQHFTSLPDDYDFRAARDGIGDMYEAQRNAFGEILAESIHGPYNRGVEFCALFSDCGYLIGTDARMLLYEVRRIMNDCLFRLIPVRGGIGVGNFGFDRTQNTNYGRRMLTEASFYGSSLVHAHKAEGCGEKGFRVFIHKSAVEPLASVSGMNNVLPSKRHPISDEEYSYIQPPAALGIVVPLSVPAENDVSHELCCLGELPLDTALKRLSACQHFLRPPPEAAPHYDQTKDAYRRFETYRTAEPSRATFEHQD